MFRHRKPWWIGFGAFILLGSIGQLFVPGNVLPILPWSINSTPQTNLLSLSSLATLQGWHGGGVVGKTGRYAGDGFWRIPRYNPDTQQEYTEIATYEVVKVKPNTLYTLSFYFRSDGTQTGLFVNFITLDRYNFVKPTVIHLGDDLYRAYASYKTKSSEGEVRGLNLASFYGNWRTIELGYPKLEEGDQPTAYSVISTDTELQNRLAWWIGTALLGLLIFQGSDVLLRQIGGRRAGAAILFGLFAHLIYAYISLNYSDSFGGRAVGLLGHPNILGHTAVVCAALIWLLSGHRTSLAGLIVMAGLVILSASRAAFIGMLVLILVWWVNLWPRIRVMVVTLLTAAVVSSAFLFTQDLGRFSVWNDDQYFSNQSRTVVWKSAMEAFMENPLTGIGINQFRSYHYTHASDATLEPLVSHTHNLFLFLLAETGLLGLFGFLSLWGSVVWQLFRWREWRVLVLLGITVVLNMFDFSLFTSSIYASLWIAIAWAAQRQYDVSGSTQSNPPRFGSPNI